LDQRLSEIDNGLRARFSTPLDYFWIAVIRPESMPSAEITFYKPTYQDQSHSQRRIAFGWSTIRELVAINAFLGTHPLEPGVGRIHQHPEGVTEIATTCEGKSRAVLRSYSEWSIVIGSRRMARNAGI
jgi:hypothetical protein